MTQIDFLKKIAIEKKPIIDELYKSFGINFFKNKIQNQNNHLFYKALSQSGLNLIAELKKASPSKGLINPNFDPQKLAITYKNAGASALSVLTEETYFQGSINYLPLAKKTTQLPILRKDFITDPIELYEAKAYGADAALLIKAMLSQEKCQDLLNCASEIGLDILLEIHTIEELEASLELKNVRIVGINNRNLHTLKVDITTAQTIKKSISSTQNTQNILWVAESGYSTTHELQALENAGFNAVLIGEGIVTNPNILEFWSKKS